MIDRALQIDSDTERWVLCYAIQERECWSRVRDCLEFRDFQDSFVRESIEIMTKANEDGVDHADMLAVLLRKLKQSTSVDAGEVASQLGKLFVDTPIMRLKTGHFDGLLRSLRETSVRRVTQFCASKLIESSYDRDASPADEAAKYLEIIRKRNVDARQLPTISDGMLDVVASFDSGKPSGLPTGFAYFDSITGGLAPGHLVTVAASTSVGKTAFALNVAVNLAKADRSVFYVSLEMSREELQRRVLAITSGVSLGAMQAGKLDHGQRSKVAEAVHQIGGWRMAVCDDGTVSVPQLSAKARQVRNQRGLDCMVVDYLGLLDADNPKASLNERVSQLSRDVKRLAMDLKIPVIILAQINREGAKVDRPRLYHLRDSGSIENDSNIVLLLSRTSDGDVLFDVAKQRSGPLGDFVMRFSGSTQVFTASNHVAEFDDWNQD